MSAHNLPTQLNQAPFEVLDPGTGVAIVVDRWNQIIPLTIAASASETNTLAAPLKAGQRLTIFAASVGSGGTRTITVASAINQAGDTTLAFANVDDYVVLESVPVGSGVYEWRVVVNEGANDSLLVPTRTITLNMLLNSHCVDQCFFIADRAYQITRIDYVHATAGNDAGAVNLQVTKDTATDAPGAGTYLLTNNTNAGFNCKATANTVQNGTLTATTASLQLAAGNRLSVDFAGTVTTLAGAQVTVTLKPI